MPTRCTIVTYLNFCFAAWLQGARIDTPFARRFTQPRMQFDVSTGNRGSAGQLVGGLETSLSAFVGNAQQSDDIAVLALTYHGALQAGGTSWRGRFTRQPFSP
jgi:hypothetical protein